MKIMEGVQKTSEEQTNEKILEKIKENTYVTIRVDKDVKRIVLEKKLNVQGTFVLGLLLATEEIPEDLKKLCDALNLNEEERKLAREYFISKLKENVKKGRYYYPKTLASYAVYKALNRNGKQISQEEIFRAGGVSPTVLREVLKEETLGDSNDTLKN